MSSRHATPAVLLPEQIVARAQETPDANAVRGALEMTYAELLGRAGAVADRLRLLGAGPEQRVAICAERSCDGLAGMLGCWLAGAAYVPLDVRWPAARIAAVIADCAPCVTLTDSVGAGLVQAPAEPLDQGTIPLDAVTVDSAPRDALAHVLYTSGSSGRPKGVLTTHANIAEFVAHVADWAPGVGADMCSAGVASWGFDAATYDLFLPLAHGGTIGLVSDAERADPMLLRDALRRMRCSFGFFTPTLLSLLAPDDLPALRTLVLGGEPVPADQATAWADDAHSRVVFDAYGPTETTVSQTAIRVRSTHRDPMPIGHDLPGQRTYVLAPDLVPVADGETGELCIGGLGVARGYQSMPGRTACVFVPDPFGAPGERMYRTGDLVRREPDGALVYLGRRDDQVKIRGQRVEPGELAHALRTMDDVREAAVVTTCTGVDTTLAAFVTPASVDTDDVLAFAAANLPDALVPSRVLAIDQLPLAGTGKVDRKALGDLLIDDSVDAAPTASGPLAQLWTQVLGAPAAPDSDFFDAGGHSISAMRLVAGVRATLARDVSVQDVFRCRTFAALQAYVDRAAPTADRLPEHSAPAPTSAQQRLWLVDRLSAQGASSYNVSFAVRIGPGLDVDRLRRALTRIEEAHDVLRWRFVGTDDSPRIAVGPPRQVPLEVRPCRIDDWEQAITTAGAVHLSLDTGDTWRATLLQAADAAVLVLTFHHCVIDGWSEKALFEQLAAAYADPEKTLPTGRFADYTVWRQARDRAGFDQDLRWWTTHLAGAPDVLELPSDRVRPMEPSERAGTSSHILDVATAEAIRQVAADRGATPAAVVLAALGVALRRLTGQHDLLVAGMRVDRPFAELESALGFYIDMQPVRLRIDDDVAAGELIDQTHRELLAGADHAAAGVQDLVTALRARREPGRQPLLQVAFNVYNFPTARPALDGLEVDRLPAPPVGSPFDLSVYLIEDEAGTRLETVYSTDLFDATRMSDLLSSLVDVLSDSAAKPDRPVGSVAGVFRTDTVAPAASAAITQQVEAGPGTLTGDTETRVARIWCDVLQVEHIPATTNFFDAGGSSLAISRVHSRLVTEFQRDIPVVALFQHPTIRAVARFLDGATADAAMERASTIAAARRARSRRRSRP
ncbi:amino acid adenylation domain-containing protein [Flexivirga sp. B27]